ncbi:FAD-dependent oxidoreductase [Flammeovirga yaeyamensis]|uniref:FAD-dependent oxidoreductase n=1 Tax=Flammeovirga yaeyamensis TaxID=367791 RepID=A0AAX1MYJ4_9BACT|nr:FAD-dependent oxidoreductase [Flammeovirga yaeyamensis]MBB3696343.1 glycine/D-amino acid oxidase-like deaminating enzyme [Flammeovirga yaeyamensis]NMF35022.1 FAD-binding oxidoreductase [Flammeovirga yaeyamensis]QWG00152.1 FAD-dependent oxidoreductase [Flammeovirga yaeyamensis]
MAYKVDYLIVGQGLAGTILAETLQNRGFSFRIIDDGTLKNSSRVAGGLYNPITGRKMVKTWLCDVLWEKIDEFYPAYDKKYSTDSFKPINLYFPFEGQEKQTDWLSASADDRYDGYIKEFHSEGLYTDVIHQEFGGMEVTRSGYLDIPVFLDAFKEQALKEDKIELELFDHQELNIGVDTIRYKNIEAKHVIFAEGNKVENNPYFPTLDFRPVKGELLLIKFKNARFNHIINRNGFILPIDDKGNCKLGATYERVEDMENPTEKGKRQLLEKVELVDDDFEILDHWSGIRPATFDRRPFIGTSKDYKNIHIFNGLGAKGVSLGPYFAQKLINHIELGDDLPYEVRLDRLSKQQRINLNSKG